MFLESLWFHILNCLFYKKHFILTNNWTYGGFRLDHQQVFSHDYLKISQLLCFFNLAFGELFNDTDL